ncbi:MAG: hypothetical protein SFU86_01615 [Pirellulaceae bacterium]|nr:hypothetical protein [Pirellulaceae bacterium]
MTLVGKIFTVLIFVMSIVFMAFSVMVFATHKNWRLAADNADTAKGALGFKQQYEQTLQLKRDADTQIQALKTTLEQERAARKAALAALTARLTRAESELSAKEGLLNEANSQLASAAEAAKAAQTRLAALETEITGLRADKRATEQDLDTKFAKVVELTDSLNQAMALSEELKERNQQATLQIARMKMVMDSRGLTVTTPTDHIAPKVDAVVLEVSDKDLIEISIGSDDGIKLDHKLDIYRDNTYLGRIVVIRVAGDRAVGRIVKELQRGQIKRGDRVSTKFS